MARKFCTARFYLDDSMPDFASAFPAPFIYVVAAQDVTFSVLTSAEFASLAEQLKAVEWKRVQDNPEFKRFEPIQKYRVREELDNIPRSLQSLIKAAETHDGARFYVGKSLEKSGYSSEKSAQIVEELPPADLLTVSLLVTRIKGLPTNYKKGKPFDRPLGDGGATGPAGAPQTEASTTGESSATASATTSPA